MLLTGLSARCMNRLSMWPRVATSGLVTEFVGLSYRQSLYFDDTGVGMDFLSRISSSNVCSIACSAGGACFLMSTMLVAQSVTVFETMSNFCKLSINCSAASLRLAGQNRCLGQGGRSPVSTISVSYTHLRAHETRHDLVCRLLLEKKK